VKHYTPTRACVNSVDAFGLDVERDFSRLKPLRLSEMKRFQDLGVSLGALLSPEPIAEARVAFHPKRPLFDFADDGVSNALVFLARSELDEPCDLVAWSPSTGRLATRYGRVALLGCEQLWAARIDHDGALVVFDSPLEWLRGEGLGVVIIDPQRAAPQLRFAGKLYAESVAAAARLDGILKSDQPKIVLPKRALEIAA